MLTVGSLFSGIGGIDLGLERAGMLVRWQSEIDPFASRVLHKHWPDVPNLGDVTTVDWSTVEPVDLICGGYPCQPFSLAGERGGEDDHRHLWPYFANAIRELRPRYALLENVTGHLSLGFGQVLGDLAALGFDAEWARVSASGLGAAHRRFRLFVVAYPMADVDRGGRDPGFWSQRSDGWSKSSHGGWWETEPDVVRVVDGVPRRVDRLRCLGNAVVPQVAEYVGRRIIAMTDGDNGNEQVSGQPDPG